MIKPRLVTGLVANYCTQIPEKGLEHPLPAGLVGIRLFDGVREYVDMLDLEVVIYGMSFAGDDCKKRFLAAMSMDDLKLLLPRLQRRLRELELRNLNSSPSLPDIVERLYTGEGPLARVIRQPDVKLGSVSVSHLERPFPEGSANYHFPIIIEGLTPQADRRVPMLLLTPKDAARLAYDAQKKILQMPFSGKRAIEIRRQTDPDGLVCF